MKNKITYSVAAASFSLVVISIISKGFGFIREIVYANSFGLSKEFDLFLVSAAIPITINTAVLYIAQHYFVPTYHKLKIISETDAQNFTGKSFYWFFFSGLILASLLAILSNPIIQLFVSADETITFMLSRNLFLLFLITIPLNAGVSILFAYLQSEYKFILPAILQLIMNIVIILMVILFSSEYNVYVLPISFIAGNLLAIVYLTFSLKSLLKINELTSVKKTDIKQSDLLFSLIIIEFVSLSYPIVDRYFYEIIPAGGIAALNYAITIYTIPVSIFTIALITTIFPKFSQSALDNKAELVTSLRKSISINIYLMVPISFVLIHFGADLIRLFYERGKFLSSDTFITSEVLKLYTISLVFYSTYLIAIKLLYSISKYKVVLYLSFSALLIKIFMNLLFVKNYFQNGLAISTSIVFLFLCIGGYFFIDKHLKEKLNLYLFRLIVINFFNAIISISIITILSVLLLPSVVNGIWIKLLFFITVFIFNSMIIKSEDYIMAKNFLLSYLDKANQNG